MKAIDVFNALVPVYFRVEKEIGHHTYYQPIISPVEIEAYYYDKTDPSKITNIRVNNLTHTIEFLTNNMAPQYDEPFNRFQVDQDVGIGIEVYVLTRKSVELIPSDAASVTIISDKNHVPDYSLPKDVQLIHEEQNVSTWFIDFSFLKSSSNLAVYITDADHTQYALTTDFELSVNCYSHCLFIEFDHPVTGRAILTKA